MSDILLIEPFFADSHRWWAQGLQQHSAHRLQLLTLPGRHWKWRMTGGTVELARQFMKSDKIPDLILASDMLDLAAFKGLTTSKTASIPTAVYFHENQITYPWSPEDPDPKKGRDHHYGWINYTTALAADRLFFNSDYHMASFLSALPDFLRQFPDKKGLDQVRLIEQKSEVLHLGMDLTPFLNASPSKQEVPVFLWNHRWEYDKAPEDFFRLLFRLKARGIDFHLIVLGRSYGKTPPVFEEAKARLQHHLLHWGFAESREEYIGWVQRANLMPVTSRQDFFGGSVVEGIAAGCFPLLPDRLAYPEHLPERLRAKHLYGSEEVLLQKVIDWTETNPKERSTADLQHFVSRYDWRNLASTYDQALS
jgi:glycosyltransferase involved in cell wall biosynthesis